MSVTIDIAETIPRSTLPNTSSSASIAFQLDSGSSTESFDINTVNVSLDVYTSAGVVTEQAIVNGLPKSGYSGFLSVLNAGTSYKLQGKLKRNADFPYNLPVTVSISGFTSPLHLPFGPITYTFTTGILSDFRPASNSPAVPSPQAPTDAAPVDKDIFFKINSNPSLSSITLSQLNVYVSWVVPAPQTFHVIVNGSVNVASGFNSLISSNSSSVSVTVLPISYFLPYGAAINVLVTGSIIVNSPLPSSVPFSQDFNFKTQQAPVILQNTESTSLEVASTVYTSVKSDGVQTENIYTGSGIVVTTSPDPVLFPSASSYVSKLKDPTNQPFLSSDAGSVVSLVSSSSPSANRTTKIVSVIDAGEVELDIVNKPPFPSSSSIDSYSIFRTVVQSSVQMRQNPSGGSSSDSQSLSTANGIMVSVQRWAQSLAAFRSSFYDSDFLSPSAPDWVVTTPASSISDSTNPALSVRSFPQLPTLSSVGFYLDVPQGMTGFRISLKGRAATIPVVGTTYYVGYALYYRPIPSNAVVGPWNTSLQLNNLTIPASTSYQYFSQVFVRDAVVLSDMLPGTLYQCQLVRVAPSGLALDLPDDFYLLNAIIDFG